MQKTVLFLLDESEDTGDGDPTPCHMLQFPIIGGEFPCPGEPMDSSEIFLCPLCDIHEVLQKLLRSLFRST